MRNNQLNLSSLLCFKVLYQTLSFSRTGEKLNMSKASVSKKILSLEADLGGKLFIRSTRKISPTQEANLLFEKVDLIFSATEEINDIFNGSNALVGNLRITAPQSMAVAFLGEILLKFQKIHPGITVEIISTDNVLDVIENNIDLCLRINPPINSSLIGRRIGSYGLHLVATPGYLEKYPVRSIKDIKNHKFISIDSHFKEWNIEIINSTLKRSFASNDSLLVGHIIRSGLAIGLRSSWDIKSDLKQGRLVEVIPSHAVRNCGDVWLLSHPAKFKLSKVQALSSYLHEELKNFLN
jgi:LysR family transcriptional regulator, transcriptional activator for dmlA